MTMKHSLALAIVLSATSYAHSEQPYVGLDYQIATITSEERSVDIGSVMLRAGTTFRKYLGAEFQLGLGVADDSFVGSDSNTYAVENGLFVAAFAKPQFNFGPHDNFSIYGLLGAAHYRTKNNAEDNSSTSSAGGAGINVFLNNGLGIGAEYVVYDADIEAVNFGVRYRY